MPCKMIQPWKGKNHHIILMTKVTNYRMLLYMTEIWRDTFNNTLEKERERKEFRLPAIIPVVLYTGQYNWTAPVQFKRMLFGR